jgi:GNAT superfamily N-acetyltransferase
MDYYFRKYLQTDIIRCAQLSVESWPAVFKLTDKDNAYKFMELYIAICLLDSDYVEVCCDDQNNVIGLMFGSILHRKSLKKEGVKRSALFRDYINGKYGNINNKYWFIISFFITEFKVWLYCKKFQSQVVLFIVDKRYQGKGIGKTLMSRYLESVKKKNIKSVYLYTDIESNWMFYENFGFKRHKSFYDNGLSVMLGEKVKSFIYYIDT